MPISRRDFVRVGTTTALLSAIPGSRLLSQPYVITDAGRLDAMGPLASQDQMRTLALRAVDAAKAAGATYADVRITRQVVQSFRHGDEMIRASIGDNEDLAMGVRALVNGYWGFAASPYWDAEEAVQLAQSAVQQAKNNALGPSRIVEWEAIPAVTGSWTTPGVDPFSISVEEKVEFMNGWRAAVGDSFRQDFQMVARQAEMEFTRLEKFLATTDGTAVLQVYYGTKGDFVIAAVPRDPEEPQQAISVKAEKLNPRQKGWEHILDAKLRDQIPSMIEQIYEGKKRTYKPVDIGSYDVVFSAPAAQAILYSTIGKASGLGRAMGYDANTSGTSYLGPDPFEFLGKPVGSPLLNVTANRSTPGLGMTKWDDEGVVPDDFTLVKDGMLVDYQTTREQAPWIKSWYQKQQRPVKSHGCANSRTAMDITDQGPANLVLQPGTTTASFDSMVAGISRGYALVTGGAGTDFQAKTGMGGGMFREIVDGKLGDIAIGAGFLFRSMEFWKNLTAVGDASSVVEGSVPITVKAVSIIDVRRRA